MPVFARLWPVWPPWRAPRRRLVLVLQLGSTVGHPSNSWACCYFIAAFILHVWMVCAFSALTLLVRWQEGHPACKKLTGGMLSWLCLGQGADLHIWPR